MGEIFDKGRGALLKTIFTTGQVATICRVSSRTVCKWFDLGRLRGYRLPGSMNRRIPRGQLIQFLRENGLPLGALEGEEIGKVLVVGTESAIRSALTESMTCGQWRLQFAESVFEAGIQVETLRPDCVVIDFLMGRNDAIVIAQNLRKNKQYAHIILVGLLSDEDNARGFDRSVFNETFRKPFDTSLLADRIQTLVGRKKELVG